MHVRIVDTFRRLAFERSLERPSCLHFFEFLEAVDEPAPAAYACLSCLQSGTRWVQLRMCMTCGSVGCCDSSEQPHAKAHFEATGHPMMRSIEPGDTWGWCYVDRAYIDWETRS